MPAVAALVSPVPGTGLTPAGFLGSVERLGGDERRPAHVRRHEPRPGARAEASSTPTRAPTRSTAASSTRHRSTCAQGCRTSASRSCRRRTRRSARSTRASSIGSRRWRRWQALQTSNASVVQQADGAGRRSRRRSATRSSASCSVSSSGSASRSSASRSTRGSAAPRRSRSGSAASRCSPACPRPTRSWRRRQLVMLNEPSGTRAETFRMLRTNLEFVTLGRDMRTIMITSAVEQEGKSTTIANLAVALAREGKRVVLVDLDLRRPFLDRFFGPGRPGRDPGRARARATLEQALVASPRPSRRSGGSRPLATRKPHGNGNGNGNGENGARKSAGVLEVLPTGPIPPDPGEFVARTRCGDPGGASRAGRRRPDRRAAAAACRRRDSLSTKVDGIVLATRMNVVRRQHAARAPPAARGDADSGARLRPHRRGAEEAGYGYGYGQYHPHAYESPSGGDRSRCAERSVMNGVAFWSPIRCGSSGPASSTCSPGSAISSRSRRARSTSCSTAAVDRTLPRYRARSTSTCRRRRDRGGPASCRVRRRRTSSSGASSRSREAVLEAMRAGAHGFLHKQISPAGLVRALRGALQRGGAALARPRRRC